MYASNASIKKRLRTMGLVCDLFCYNTKRTCLVYQSLSNMLYCASSVKYLTSSSANAIAVPIPRLVITLPSTTTAAQALCTEQLFLKTRMTGSFFALKYMILTEHARRCTYRCNKLSLSSKSLNCLYYGLIRAKV